LGYSNVEDIYSFRRKADEHLQQQQPIKPTTTTNKNNNNNVTTTTPHQYYLILQLKSSQWLGYSASLGGMFPSLCMDIGVQVGCMRRLV
jgi:hypothetical protein